MMATTYVGHLIGTKGSNRCHVTFISGKGNRPGPAAATPKAAPDGLPGATTDGGWWGGSPPEGRSNHGEHRSLYFTTHILGATRAHAFHSVDPLSYGAMGTCLIVLACNHMMPIRICSAVVRVIANYLNGICFSLDSSLRGLQLLPCTLDSIPPLACQPGGPTIEVRQRFLSY